MFVVKNIYNREVFVYVMEMLIVYFRVIKIFKLGKLVESYLNLYNSFRLFFVYFFVMGFVNCMIYC